MKMQQFNVMYINERNKAQLPTRGVANGGMTGVLGAGSPASSSFSSGDENVGYAHPH
jgi:hypothetical protein